MFCLGCGAETPPRATRCPVCGRDTRGATGEVHWAVSPTESSPGASVPAPPSSLSGAFAAVRLTAPASTIGAGALDVPGIPRDAYGRALLIATAAMAADLLAPWIVQYGQQSHSPAEIGGPVLGVVLVLGLAIVPLIRPSFRVRPALAAMPIVVGGMFLSLSLVTWGLVTYTSIQSGSIPSGPPVISPGVGLYLFILGSAVLIVSGYQIFLQAARRSAPPQIADLAVPQPVASGPSTISAERAQEPSDSDPAAPAQLPTEEASEPALPAHTASGDAGNAPHVVLPGSASWHEEPKLPAYTRPSPLGGGWSRQPRPRR